MPMWIFVYLCLFLVLSVGGIWDDYQDQRPAWHLICAALATIVITLLFVSRWHMSFQPAFPAVIQVVFLAAIAWELFSFISDLRSIRRDPDFTNREYIIFTVVSIVFVSAVSLPAFIIAGITVFKRQ